MGDPSKYSYMDRVLAYCSYWTDFNVYNGIRIDHLLNAFDIRLHMGVLFNVPPCCMRYFHRLWTVLCSTMPKRRVETQHPASRPTFEKFKTWIFGTISFF